MMKIEHQVVLHGRRDNRAWFEPGIAVYPSKTSADGVEAMITAKLLTGNDIGPLVFIRSFDKGNTWTSPVISQNWHKIPLNDDIYEEAWFVPFYHEKTRTLAALGNTHFVRDEGGVTNHKNEAHVVRPPTERSAAYSIWNEQSQDFEPWKKIKLPKGVHIGLYYNADKYQAKDGTILVPGYEYGKADAQGFPYMHVTVIRLSFDGREFSYVEHGPSYTVQEGRGFAEPSVIQMNDIYYMTIRNDVKGYVTKSTDGFSYDAPKPWTFDDGTDLGNYNTQQHWLRYENELYLVYNRKSDQNRGVFRSRAPLYIARVDMEKLCVIRESEKVVIAANRARMGNFCVAEPSANERWIVTGEWIEGFFDDVKKTDRFYVKSDAINTIRYIGDLLLAKIRFD